MAKLEVKYCVGDVVYVASTVCEEATAPCPDCLGSKEWKTTSPAGVEYLFACPRCSTAYQRDRFHSLKYMVQSPEVNKLTIGSIRVDTYETNNPVTYMCVETGLGGGRVYNEADLFESEEEALDVAKHKANLANSGPLRPQVIHANYRLQLSDYQLHQIPKKLRKSP